MKYGYKSIHMNKFKYKRTLIKKQIRNIPNLFIKSEKIYLKDK